VAAAVSTAAVPTPTTVRSVALRVRTNPEQAGRWTPTGTSRVTGFASVCGTPPSGLLGLAGGVRVRDLRHAHASWVLAGGADLQIVRERLGHAGLRATERYLHTLPDAGDAALAALNATRSGTRTTAAS
jgi:integrase